MEISVQAFTMESIHSILYIFLTLYHFTLIKSEANHFYGFKS